MELIPLDHIGTAAALAAPFVLVLVEMLKAVGVKGSRLTSACAVVAGQAVVLAHWWVAWPHTPQSLYIAVLVGIAASAVSMKLWDKVLKAVASVMANTKPPTP